MKESIKNFMGKSLDIKKTLGNNADKSEDEKSYNNIETRITGFRFVTHGNLPQ
jgi:hypothetical protein